MGTVFLVAWIALAGLGLYAKKSKVVSVGGGFIGALLIMGLFGEATNEPKVRQEAAAVTSKLQQPRTLGDCSKNPLEVFPVGERLGSEELVRLTDTFCPTARYYPDERIEVTFGGRRYFVQTKKLNFTGPAFYEVVSIKAAD